ncbi:phytoene/squalene synthase family protein [Halanaeroarchaeum sulfurireducens]|uniref:Phytoene synthase n=1 Tax=Halanaeroarchaeum sulfurireducens TaxID=1604004 RepID=A0A0N9N253_9EURY|nr:phytoene/squalene synthase family protein [Halanaeroarchaeum sulfurireducens]ALG81153.1 phytoene synthase [Halanaeroarchaeum sulfurireducens]
MSQQQPSQDDIAESKAIQRGTGATFHVATRVLPERARHPTYVLYAFFRIADEIVDDPGDATAAEQREGLERIRAVAKGEREADGPVLAATNRLRQTHDLDPSEIEFFIDAMLSDVSVRRYETYADLESYLRGSSVAVARMLVDVMAPDLPESAQSHARALAEAFQLTNFVRDVREDVDDYDRIYLPLATLEKYGVGERDIRAKEFTPGVAAAVLHELERAEERYRTGVEGIEYLPEDVQFAVLLSAILYAEHHRLIRRRGYDVLTNPPELSWLDRARAVARTTLHWKMTNDPVVTFERASAVPVESTPDSRPSASGGRFGPAVHTVADGLMRWSS